jgi:CheY-like chemotaxis protein
LIWPQSTGQSTDSSLHDPQLVLVFGDTNAVSGDREACLKGGMDDYITKPIQPDQLAQVVHRAAARKNRAAA